MKDKLVIGTRGSKLALWQAEWARTRLAALRPGLDVRVEVVKTAGDRLPDAPLSVIGGQGAFTGELEHAVLAGRIDLAVHSLKDLPTVIPEQLTLAAVPEREDPRDALVLPAGARGVVVTSVYDLPVGSRVGTSSPRRRAQLLHLRPDLSLKELRGNVDTRLRKLDTGEFDAVVLAAAGLRRLGLGARISATVTTGELLPAVGQGALGLEARRDDEGLLGLLARLDHAPTRAEVAAERAMLRRFGAGCQIPLAAHAMTGAGALRLEGLVASLDGEALLRESIEGRADEAERLGEELALTLQLRGATFLLAGEAAPVW